MRTALLLFGLFLLCGPSQAAIEPPSDPRQVEIALSILKDTEASENQKLEALTSFTLTTNLTDEAFWTLLKTASSASNGTDAVRMLALIRLASAIAYVLPEDRERGEHLIELLMAAKFKTAFAAMEQDPLAGLRAERLYFFGAVTLNIPPALTRRLGPVFLPMLLWSLRTESDPNVINEGLWALGRLLEIKMASIEQAAQTLQELERSFPDAGIRESAKLLLVDNGVLPRTP